MLLKWITNENVLGKSSTFDWFLLSEFPFAVFRFNCRYVVYRTNLLCIELVVYRTNMLCIELFVYRTNFLFNFCLSDNAECNWIGEKVRQFVYEITWKKVSCIRNDVILHGIRKIYIEIYRSSRPEVFCKKGAPRNFTRFTGKHLCQSLFLNKVTGLAHPPRLFFATIFLAISLKNYRLC